MRCIYTSPPYGVLRNASWIFFICLSVFEQDIELSEDVHVLIYTDALVKDRFTVHAEKN